MPAIPQNFVDLSGPVISAAWLNRVDLATLAMTGNVNGNVGIGPPTSGPALTVVNLSGQDAIDINLNQAPGAGFAMNIVGSSAADVRGIQVTNTFSGSTAGCYGFLVGVDTTHTFIMGKTGSLYSGSKFINGPAGETSWLWSGGNVPIVIAQGSGQQVMGFSANGAATIGPPLTTGNTSLTVTGDGTVPALISNGAAFGSAGQFKSSAATGSYIQFVRTGAATATGYVGNSGALGGTLDNLAIRGVGIDFLSNDGAHVAASIASAGNVTINAPSSGVALAVTEVAGAAAAAITVTGTGGTCLGTFAPAATAITVWSLNQTSQASWSMYQPASSGDLRFFSGSDRLIITANGNVSIVAPTSGQALVVNGVSGQVTENIFGANVSGSSFGLNIVAGFTSADWAIAVQNRAQTANFMKINGDGSGYIGWNGSAQTIQFGADGSVTIPVPSSANSGLNLVGNATSNVPLSITSAANTSCQINVSNTSAGTAASANLDLNNGSVTGGLTYGGTGNTGALLGANTLLLFNNGSNAINIATNNSIRISIAGGGIVTVNAPAAGNALVVNGVAGTAALFVSAPNTAGSSKGMNVTGGTNSSDFNCIFNSASGTLLGELYGDGGFALGNPVGTTKGLGTINLLTGLFVQGIAASTATTTTSAAINTVETYIATPLQIPANSLAVGMIFRITIHGTCTSTVASNTTTFNVRLGANGTTADAVMGVLNTTSPATGSGNGFSVVLTVIVRAIGAGGSVIVNGFLINFVSAGISNQVTNTTANGATAVSTTGALQLGVSFVSSAATTTATFDQVTVERVF